MKASGIGGQAVMEGVMMKNREMYAVSVRKPDGEIETKIEKFTGIAGKVGTIAKVPFIRGVFNFIDSLSLGMQTLTWSSEFFVDEEETEKMKAMSEAELAKAKKKEDGYVTVAPALKFVGMLGILLTFLVFNILLAGAEGRDPQANWRIGSLCAHVVLPIMYVTDWFLFYERKKLKLR